MDWKRDTTGADLANTESCDDVGIPWTTGVRSSTVVNRPLVCRLNPRRGRQMRDLFLIDIPLFSDRLLSAIRNVGVDNVDVYDVSIQRDDGRIFSNYKAVNIIGAVRCAQLSKSVFRSDAELPYLEFSHLVLDRARVRDHEFFRLAEDPLVIVVSERVQRAVAAIDPVGVSLTPIEVTS